MRRHSDYPISKQIISVLDSSGLRAEAFVRACGFENTASGLRALDSWLLEGQGPDRLLDGLRRVYPASETEILRALRGTLLRKRQEAIEAEEREIELVWRQLSPPFLLPIGERALPEPLEVAASSGRALRRYRLDPEILGYAWSQTLRSLRAAIVRHFENSRGECHYFGRTVNYLYVPDRRSSFLFDVDGDFLAEWGPYRPERFGLRICGRFVGGAGRAVIEAPGVSDGGVR